MGPQLYRCGNQLGRGRGQTALSRFNGAATLSLRKLAAVMQYPMGSGASMGPQLYRCGNPMRLMTMPMMTPCFNGAATLSLRKLMSPLAALASMDLLQWGRNFIVAETVWRRASPRGIDMLQWGRNFIVAETVWRRASPRGIDMLQWGRNFIVAETRVILLEMGNQHIRFNGAATLSLRKLLDTRLEPVSVDTASMGPQLYRCGNMAETCDECGDSVASMGPQLYRCGNRPPLFMRWMGLLRFNGAATLSLRKRLALHTSGLRGGVSFNGAATLSLRKLCLRVRFLSMYSKLQWGRNFIVAETT